MENSGEGSVKKRGGARIGAGRPKLDEPHIRDDVSFYLQEKQWAALQEAALSEGDKTLSTYLNKLVRNRADALIKKKESQKQ